MDIHYTGVRTSVPMSLGLSHIPLYVGDYQWYGLIMITYLYNNLIIQH